MNSVAPFEVGLVVADFEAMLPFYTGVLGFAVVSDIVVPPEKSEPSGLSASGYRVVRLETNLGNRFKLAKPLSAPDATAALAYAMDRQGGWYATFIVDGLDALYARLVAAGVKMRSRGIIDVRAGLRLMLANDPEGNFLEFVEYADLGAYRATAGNTR